MEALVLQNAAYDEVLQACKSQGISLEQLCDFLVSLSDVSPAYLERLGKKVLQLCENQGNTASEQAYEVISGALTCGEDSPFCWVQYSGTKIRILNPYAELFVDGDGDCLGLKLWEAEIVALEWMETCPEYIQDCHVVELGCGVALAGFAAIERLGAASLTLCDYNPRVWENLRHVVAGKHGMEGVVEIVSHDWNAAANKPPLGVQSPAFIVAADCVYDPDDIPNFVKSIKDMLLSTTTSSTCLLVCSVRNPATYSRLEAELTKLPSAIQVCTTPPGTPRYSTRTTHMMNHSFRREDVVLWLLCKRL